MTKNTQNTNNKGDINMGFFTSDKKPQGPDPKEIKRQEAEQFVALLDEIYPKIIATTLDLDRKYEIIDIMDANGYESREVSKEFETNGQVLWEYKRGPLSVLKYQAMQLGGDAIVGVKLDGWYAFGTVVKFI